MLESMEEVESRLGWCANLRKCMQKLDIQLNAGQDIDERMVMDRAQAMWVSRLGSMTRVESVRSIPDSVSKDFKAITYFSWFAAEMGPDRKFWFHLNRADLIKTVARYRMGNSWLEIESGRYQRVPRSLRVCPCSTCIGALRREDEAHLMVCPLYEGLREKYMFNFGVANEGDNGDDDEYDADTFAEDCIREFMNVPDDAKRYWGRVAGFLLSSKRIRDADMQH
jgi:hypothetical protein